MGNATNIVYCWQACHTAMRSLWDVDFYAMKAFGGLFFFFFCLCVPVGLLLVVIWLRAIVTHKKTLHFICHNGVTLLLYLALLFALSFTREKMIYLKSYLYKGKLSLAEGQPYLKLLLREDMAIPFWLYVSGN